MRKFLLYLLLPAFLYGCTADVEEAPYVTDVVLSPATVVAPGDEVTVTARGFEADDDIMFRVTWPFTDATIKEGYADGVWGIVTARTATSITFLAPGRYPASTVDVKLLRHGRPMTLGTIRVADGQAPAEYSLYGITESDSEGASIENIDLTTGKSTLVRTLDAGQHLACAVNSPGTNSIYGVSPGGENGVAVCYDLTMRYFRNSGNDRVLTVGEKNSNVAYFRCVGDRLTLYTLNTTRMPNMEQPFWKLPEGITGAMLAGSPVVFYDSMILLSACVGDGTYRPVVLTLTSSEGNAYAGAPTQAERMFPVDLLEYDDTSDTEGCLRPCYAVAWDGKTRLAYFDVSQMDVTRTIAEVSGTVLSAAVQLDLDKPKKIYLLCDDGDARRIRVYDNKTEKQITFPGAVTCSQIVLVR